jgi:CRP/FNR family transcriptional regulator, cyclic AMP receptor protein
MAEPQHTAAVRLVSALTQSAGRVEGIVLRRIHEKECLYNQKDPANWFFYILSGHVRTYILSEEGRERTLRILGPDDLAGEDAFYLQSTYIDYADAFEGPVELIQVSRAGYHALLSRWPELYEELLACLAGVIRELIQAIEMQTFQDLRGRVQMALIGAAGRYGRVGPDGVVIDINLTHETIASLVGATRTRVSICLSELQHEGFYHVANQCIVLSPWVVGLVLPP